MSVREVVVLGTASQVPTKARNHNGYLVRWDGEGLLFDPGEGSQRQMTLAGVAANDITRICLTHFHGDHCLGVPGIIQRISLDRVTHPVYVHYPASGRKYFSRLRRASAFYDAVDLREVRIRRDGVVARGAFGELQARRLDHGVEAYGYRLVEPDGRRMLPERLAEAGVGGPAVGELQRAGVLTVAGRAVTLEEVSEVRRGQRLAFIMDTRLCDAVHALADRADLLIIESTFLHRDLALATDYGHLTARQAAQVAADSGVRRLVLTHFSGRYDDPAEFAAEAAEVFAGEIVVARDLDRVAVPPRR